jgi:hypothetical protein
LKKTNISLETSFYTAGGLWLVAAARFQLRKFRLPDLFNWLIAEAWEQVTLNLAQVDLNLT